MDSLMSAAKSAVGFVQDDISAHQLEEQRQKLDLSVISLLNLNMRDASVGGASTKEDPAATKPVAKPAAGGGAEPPASTTALHDAAAGVAAPSRLASRTPARHLLLAKQLRFGDMSQQVGLTRHCLVQLQFLDVPRRAAALRLLHCLGSNQLENQEALESEGHEGLFYSHSDLRRRAEVVFIVWERSTPAQPFFEACQHSAARVWSIETQLDNLAEVAEYVAKAWHFGGLAETASVAASYPMGSTSNQDAPGEIWHPCHAADEADSSVQVPYVIKW